MSSNTEIVEENKNCLSFFLCALLEGEGRGGWILKCRYWATSVRALTGMENVIF